MMQDTMLTYTNAIATVSAGGYTVDAGDIVGTAGVLFTAFSTIPFIGPALSILSVFLPNGNQAFYEAIMEEVNDLVDSAILNNARAMINHEMQGFVYALSFGNTITDDTLFSLRQRAPHFFAGCWTGHGGSVDYGIDCQRWQRSGSVALGIQFTLLHMTMILDLAARGDTNAYLSQLRQVQSQEVALLRASFDQFRSHRLNVIQRHKFRNVLSGSPTTFRNTVDFARDNYIGGGRELTCGGRSKFCTGSRYDFNAWDECGSWKHHWDSCFNNYRRSIESALNNMGNVVTTLEGLRP